MTTAIDYPTIHSINLSRTDDRRNRRYAWEVLVTVDVPTAWDLDLHLDDVPHELRERVAFRGQVYSALGVTWGEGGKVEVAPVLSIPGSESALKLNVRGYCYGLEFYPRPTSWCPTPRLVVRMEAPAEKPSALPDEEAVHGVIEAHLIKLVGPALEALAKRQGEMRAAAKLAKEAQHVSRWAERWVEAKAKAICRYEQRLAALKAELQAEKETQLRALRDGEAVRTWEALDEDQRVSREGLDLGLQAVPIEERRPLCSRETPLPFEAALAAVRGDQ